MKRTPIAGLLVVSAIAGAALGYWLPHQGVTGADAPAAATAGAGAAPPRTVLYWYDPMVPAQHFDQPGKSPYMDMPLVARYADDDASGGVASVAIDPRMAQNLGVRLAAVERGTLAPTLDVPATVALNDRSVAVVQARAAGFVERVYGRAPGDVIAAGAPLVDLLVPDWAGAQSEFLALLRVGDAALVGPARERLRLLGMPPPLIAAVEASGQTHPVFTVVAPIGGLIKALDARTGMSIAAGATLARINGLETVWLDAALPEAQAGRVAAGQRVQVSLTAFPGQALAGTLIAVLPEVDAESRTLRARVELPNPGGRLRPGMVARLRIDTGTGASGLLVPAEAVVRTGTRTIVFVALEQGRYRPVEVTLGRESGDKAMVTAGLSEGQQVVSSGQFLIDSEAGLRGALARLEPPPGAAPPGAALHRAVGTVESIADGRITLSHGAVPTLGWGPMTMGFGVARPELLAGIARGDRVDFAFRKGDQGYVIETLGKHAGPP